MFSSKNLGSFVCLCVGVGGSNASQRVMNSNIDVELCAVSSYNLQHTGLIYLIGPSSNSSQTRANLIPSIHTIFPSHSTITPRIRVVHVYEPICHLYIEQSRRDLSRTLSPSKVFLYGTLIPCQISTRSSSKRLLDSSRGTV